MIKLLAGLAVFLFVGMWFLGADHGQFINPPHASIAATQASAVARPVFVPAPRTAESALGAVAEPQAAEGAQSAAQPAQPEPQLAAIKLMHVPGGASVRSGPGREFGVIGDLSGGDAVMVIDDTSAPGWVRIRVDGQGEGWVAAKLLRE